MEGKNNNQNTVSAKKRKRTTSRMRARRKKRIIIVCLELIMLIVLAGCAWAVRMMDMYNYKGLDEDKLYIPTFDNPSNEVVDGGEGEQQENYGEVLEGYTNIALIGVDARDNSTLTSGTNSDVIIICSINNETKDVKLLSVYRDTYMMMADKKTYQKANYALMKGDITDTVNVLNMNLDLNITEYVVVNWAAVANAIDILGGIDVEITDELINQGQLNGYITDVVKATGMPGEQIWEPGVYHLSGVQAVAYCRIRYVGTDTGRTERQREVIQKMVESAKTASFGTILRVVNEVLPNIASSLDKAEILSMAGAISKYNIVDQSGFPFQFETAKWVGGITNCDWPIVANNFEQNVVQLHQFLFGGEVYSPSAKVKEVSSYLRDISGVE